MRHLFRAEWVLVCHIHCWQIWGYNIYILLAAIFSDRSLMLSQLLLWIIICSFGVHLLGFPYVSILLQVRLSVFVLTDLAIFPVSRNRPPHSYNGTALIAATLSHYLPIVVAA